MPSDDEIIKAIYAMVIGPYRYEDLCGMLVDRLDARGGIAAVPGEEAARLKSAFGTLDPHFSHAQSLLDAQGSARDTEPFSRRTIDEASVPAVLVERDGRIVHTNRIAREFLDFESGEFLGFDHFGLDHGELLLRDLRKLDEHSLHDVIRIVDFYPDAQEEPIKLALTKVLDGNGHAIGHLSGIKVSWFPEMGRRFQSLFGLTPAELAITRAVVIGKTLAELAEERGRSLGTVRQQTKALLAKLHIHSQSELTHLYSGLLRYRNSAASDEMQGPNAREGRLMTLPDGRKLCYHFIGPENGRPCLFLPALIGGMATTEEMRDGLRKANIRLIGAWRPGLSESSADPGGTDGACERFAGDLAHLLDELGVAACPLLGMMSAAPFAHAAAAHLPDRITGVVMVNSIVPNVAGPHVRLLDRQERLRNQLLRSMPSVGQFIIRGALAKIDSGYDQEYVLKLIRQNRHDIATTEREDIRAGFRNAFRQTTLRGYDGFVRDQVIVANPWTPVASRPDRPIVHLTGEFNRFYHPAVLTAYAHHNPDFTFREVKEAGHFLLYQKSEVVFGAIAGTMGGLVPPCERTGETRQLQEAR